MNVDEVLRLYNEAIFDTNRDQALRVVREAAGAGLSPEDIVFKVVMPSMDQMIRAVSENMEANLAQHFLTARIADTVTAEMVPRFAKAPEIQGRMVIGTIKGDFHTLGKRLVQGCLRARMIEVIDLGVNLPAEAFVEGALKHNAEVIGISSLMVHTATSEHGCLRVRQLLREQNLEGRIRIIVGGAPFRFHPQLYRTVGADAWAPTAPAAGDVVEALFKEVRK